MRLTLVVHAATAAGRRGVLPAPDEPAEPVPPQGRWRGRALTAPERRCTDTAAALGLDAAVEPALRDLDLGGWTGRALTDLDGTALATWRRDPDAAPHGGEPLRALLARAGAWLDALDEESLIAVTHGAVVRALHLHVLRAPPDAFWRVEAAAGTVTSLSRHAGRWTLRSAGVPLSPRRR